MILSQSRMNRFYKCPSLYDLVEKGIVGLPKESIALAVGENVHTIFKIFYDTIPNSITAKKIKTHALDIMEKNINFELKSHKRRIKTTIDGFIEFEQQRLKEAKKYLPNFCEKKFKNSQWRGTGDMHYDTTLVDFKSGRNAIITPSLVRQGMIYKVSFEQEGYVIDRVIFAFITVRRTLTMPTSTAGWLNQEREKMLDHIKHGRFPRKASPLCRSCPYEIRCEFQEKCLWVM